ncbi:hypothetical protein LL06_25570 [Hoeflea sp. BAL378]|uniref:hypothetical protein n=1 Tax=Hoeflea sp. BAL378 TaxID=1547437 RepID=UPI000513DDFB|nr:hypothetical protein [Hoeflea sp. BAL378]KGF66920.1 hypothetical protein LL06_25570 [Hoeflea sp. BAL378]
MRGLSYWFFLSATIYVTAGMFLGIGMAASGDHTLASAHAHLNLVGWVSMGLYALFYHARADVAEWRAGKVHFVLATLGLWTMVPGIALAVRGRGEGLAVAGSLATLASMLLFVGIVISAGLSSRTLSLERATAVPDAG